jgi:acyl-CoA reductase-like NAD-dependent aldehyde dehydrogenase
LIWNQGCLFDNELFGPAVMRAKDDAHAIELAIIRNLVWVLEYSLETENVEKN